MKWPWLRIAVMAGSGCLSTSAAMAALSGAANCAVDADSHGKVSIYFIVPKLPPEPNRALAAVAQAVQSNLSDPQLDVDEEKKVVTLNAMAQRSFRHGLFKVAVQIDPNPLLQFIRHAGVAQLEFRIQHPVAEYSRISPKAESISQTGSSVEALYQFPVRTTNWPPVQIGFGYYPATVAWHLTAAGLIWAALLALTLQARAPQVQIPSQMRANALSSSDEPPAKTPGFLAFLSVRWLIWAGAALALRLDQMLSFVINSERLFEKFIACAGLILLPPSLIQGLADWRRKPNQSGKYRSAAASWIDQILFLFPLILLACAAAAEWRELDLSRAQRWLMAAVILALFEAGILIVLRKTSRPRPGQANSFLQQRRWQSHFRSKAAVVLTAVVLSCASAAAVREGQVDESVRYWIYLGSLMLIAGITMFEGWVICRQSGPAPGEDSPQNGAGSRAGVLAETALTVAVAAAIAFGLVYLLEFPLNLAQGDEGWAAVILTALAVLIYCAGHSVRPSQSNPAAE